MKIQNIDINLLKEYENNPRLNDHAVDKVAKSIKEFGFKVPIVIDENYVIVTGHTRIKAAKELGLEKVPCLIADDLSPSQIKAFRLADNKVSEFATWDENKLFDELMDLQVVDFNIETFGFETKTIETPVDDYEEEEEVLNTDTNFNYKEQYGVIVMCKDEREQEEVYNTLLELGYECKVVTT